MQLENAGIEEGKLQTNSKSFQRDVEERGENGVKKYQSLFLSIIQENTCLNA